MSNAVFPDLPGLTWDVAIEDTFDTIIQKGSNRYETRLSKDPYPITRYTLTYEFLDETDEGGDDVDKIRGFFLSRRGDFDSFLLDLSKLTLNPKHGSVVGQVLTLDANNNAQLVHTLGSSGYDELIYELNGGAVIKANGAVVPQLSGSAPGLCQIFGPNVKATYDGASYPGKVVKFSSVPAAPVTADFSWYHRVRFENNAAEVSYFMYQLAELKQISLITARDI